VAAVSMQAAVQGGLWAGARRDMHRVGAAGKTQEGLEGGWAGGAGLDFGYGDAHDGALGHGDHVRHDAVRPQPPMVPQHRAVPKHVPASTQRPKEACSAP
jgi:hypothetical protein